MKTLLTSMPTHPANPPPRPPRRRLRFTLRLLLAGITLLCLALGLWTHRAREQRRLVERIRKSGGQVYYDFERERVGQYFGVHYGYREADQRVFINSRGQSPVPRALLDRLGVDFFHQPVHADVHEPQSLAAASQLTSLEELAITSSGLSDRDLESIAALRRLESLFIIPNDYFGAVTGYPKTTRLSDRSLAVIGRLPRIEYLYFYGDRITADGLKSLAAAATLQNVLVTCCEPSVVAADADCFRQTGKIASLEIRRWSPSRDGEEVVVDW
jgi:hypothetical protein